MTKTLQTLAALFLATSALSSAAEAGGGVRLQFGGPLGSFTAHPHLSSGPGGTARYAHSGAPSYKRHLSKPAYIAAARQKTPKINVAQAQPRKSKLGIERAATPKAVQTAKLEDPAVSTDAAPVVIVPRTPELPVVGTQSTPSAVPPSATAASPAATGTAALQPVEIKPAVSIAPDAEPQVQTAAPVSEPLKAQAAPAPAPAKEEPKVETAKSDSMATRICRRFSAVIAGLIEVPCE